MFFYVGSFIDLVSDVDLFQTFMYKVRYIQSDLI